MHHTYMFSNDFWDAHKLIAHHFTLNQNDTPVHKINASKFSKCEPCHEHKQKPQDIAQPKPYLKVLYNACALLLITQW